jgi:hypothetical protein
MDKEAITCKHCEEPPWIVRDWYLPASSPVRISGGRGCSIVESYAFLGAFHDGAREACPRPERARRRHCSMFRCLRNEHVVSSVWRSLRALANASCR